ncbi:MAG: DUF4955 domain-containing protein [Spirochaetes bacterium]|nr:DUF4955 domain-containing protein [Spirochaetota bacterium]
MKIRMIVLAAVITFTAVSLLSSAETSRLWNDFLEAREKGTEPMLPDFSCAGYNCGETPIPDVAGPVFDVTKYGALPDDEISDRTGIQAAIRAAEKAGGGIVFFPPGVFRVHEAGDPNETITVRKGRIVFRGSGAGAGGTVLYMHAPLDPKNPQQMWTTPPCFSVTPAGVDESLLTDITGPSLRESRGITVASSAGIKPGDRIVLSMQSTAAVDEFLAPYRAEPSWKVLQEKGIMVQEKHEVASVNGRTVVLREPIHVNINPAYGWKVYRYGCVSNIGIEDIWFRGNWKDNFVHHRSALDDSGFSGFNLARAADSWVRRCRFTDFNQPVSVSGCKSVSVMQVLLDGTPGHSACTVSGSYGTWVGLVRDDASHWHAPGVTGQNAGAVFYRIEYNGDACMELHAAQPYDTLYDAVRGGIVYAREGGAVENLPNHLRRLVLWNFEQTGKPIDKFSYWRTDKGWAREVKPIIAGFHGVPTTFDESTLEVNESYGTPVAPESLWEAQFIKRMGALPAWLAAARTDWTTMLSLWQNVRPADIAAGRPASVEDAAGETAAAATPAVTDGLSASWPCNEKSGTVILDKAGDSRGALHDADREPGRTGNAVVFGGNNNSYLEIPSTPAINASHEFTAVFWMRCAGPTGGYQNLFGKTEGKSRNYFLYMGKANGQLTFSANWEDAPGDFTVDNFGVTVWDGAWHHVAVRFDGSARKLSLFVDGVMKKTLDTKGAVLAGNRGPLLFGQGLSGALDEIKFYQRTLSDDEIVRDWKAGDAK